MSCTFDLSGTPSGSQRRFTGVTGLPLISPGGGRMVNLATVLRIIFRRALVQTSDTRLLPSGGVSWSSSDLTLGKGAEARLPELLLRLKNGERSKPQCCHNRGWSALSLVPSGSVFMRAA